MSGKVENKEMTPGTKPGVIPTSQVIVLKEHELDCDLATAIRRIRANEETAHSRILVVAPDDEPEDGEPDSVEAALPRAAPTTLGQVSRRAQQSALRRLGTRLQPLESCLHLYLAEMAEALQELEQAQPRAPGPLPRLARALEWAQSLADDLTLQARGAADGFCQVETHELLVEMAGQVEAAFPRLRITVAPAVAAGDAVWARPAELAEAFFLGLVLVAHRIGGVGSITVEVERAGGSLAHRLFGSGQPRSMAAPDTIARFRELIVDLHGGRIHHDDLGPHGTGIVIHLPV